MRQSLATRTPATSTTYQTALTQYNRDKATYDTTWSQYKIAHTQWEADTISAYDGLVNAITSYNASFKSGTFVKWTQFELDRSYQKSVVTQSDPGKILSGGSMSLTGSNLLNDKSQILAGGHCRVTCIT
jgi:adhesin HecA-like repeat protein